nr:HlyD family efflux transporter periplasmic adaptor subunit [uncultured Blautia sp.]
MPSNSRNSRENTGFLKKLRKLFSMNIGTMLFGMLFIYMAFSAILYLTSPKIESYQVIAGPLSRNETYTGLAIREESVHQAETSGYITYYAREGSKINADGVVYGISSTKTSDSQTELSADELSSIRNQMLNFSKGFNSSKFNTTYSFKYELEGNILQYAGVTGNSTSDQNDSTSSVVSYGNQTINKADSDGIILYSKDGYEGRTVDSLTTEDFDQNSYHETDLKTQNSVNTGDSLYTLITDEKWSLVIPLSEKQAVKLADRTAVRVKFLKDDKTQSGDFSIIEIDGAKYGKIDFNKGLIRYASDRFLEIELVTNTVTGLKVPLSSIVTKEFYIIPSKYATTNADSQETGFMVQSDGKNNTFVTSTIYAQEEQSGSKDDGETSYLYYVDKKDFKEGDVIISQKDQSKFVVSDIGVLEGVYCINQGYAVFRRIEILDQNEEYAIVSKATSYGLSRYDHIVRNADNVNEEDILY